MALSLESQGRVRQKAREFIKNPGVFYTLKAFFLYLSIYKKNVDGLQLVVLDPTALTTAGGQVLADVPATVYVAWSKKQDTSVASYLQLHAAANTDTGANIRVLHTHLVANQEDVSFYPDGIAFVTGVAAGAMTGPIVAIESSAADAPNGFVILGA